MTLPDAPPRPRTLKVRLDDIGDGLAFRLRNPQIATSAFLFLWLTGWTVGCVFLAFEVAKAPQLGVLLFAVPFWASWFFVAGLIVYNYTLHETFRLDLEGIKYRRQAVFVLLRREIPLNEILSFAEYEEQQQSEGSATSTFGIEMTGLGRSLRFASNLPLPEREWLIDQLQETLARLKAEDRFGLAGGDRGLGSDDSTADSETGANRPTAASEYAKPMTILEAASTPLDPPSDSTWRATEDVDAIHFAQRGRLNYMLLPGLLFICVFWNGIVSVFLCTLWGLLPGAPPPAAGMEWWGMFIFLIPFQAIGLWILTGLLLTLLEPVRTTRWSVTRDTIRCRIAWFGVLGRKWTYDCDSFGRLTIGEKYTGLWQFIHKEPPQADGLHFALVIVDADNTEICSICGLSRGEVLWMGDVLLQTHAEWFPSTVS